MQNRIFAVLVVLVVVFSFGVAHITHNYDSSSGDKKVAEAAEDEFVDGRHIDYHGEPYTTAKIVEEPQKEEEHEGVLREKILALDPPGEYAFVREGTLGFNEVYSFALQNLHKGEPYFLQILIDELEIFSSIDELGTLSEEREFFEEVFFFENPHLKEEVRKASSVREVVEILHEGGYRDIDVIEKGTDIWNHGWDPAEGRIKRFEQTLTRDRFVLLHEGVPVILASCGNPILIPVEPEPEPKPDPEPRPDPEPKPRPRPKPDPDPRPRDPDPPKPPPPAEKDPDPGPGDEPPVERPDREKDPDPGPGDEPPVERPDD